MVPAELSLDVLLSDCRHRLPWFSLLALVCVGASSISSREYARMNKWLRMTRPGGKASR